MACPITSGGAAIKSSLFYSPGYKALLIGSHVSSTIADVQTFSTCLSVVSQPQGIPPDVNFRVEEGIDPTA